MEKIKDFFKRNTCKIIPFLIFTIFIVVSAKLTFFSGRLGWEDESHFWIIVKNCSISQIFDLMKVEGHMMLWYLIVKPFTNFSYPYPMQILNWTFCLMAMVILWKKAPFNKITKSLIILCPIFLQLFSVHARCYSLGILLLFLTCALYKERLNKPYIFFLLLFLAANTHIQTLIAASAIGLLFLYDLIKNKKYKETIIISIMTILSGIILLIQFHGVSIPDYEEIVETIVNSSNNIGLFLGTIPIQNDIPLLMKIIAARCFTLIITIAYATRARAFFVYAIIIITSMYFFEYVYLPRYWHQAFFLVYFIVTYWLFLEEKPSVTSEKLLKYCVYALLLSILPMKIIVPHDNDFLYYTVMNNYSLQNGKIFTDVWPITISISLPKLNESGIYIYDMQGRNLSSYEGLKTYYNEKLKKYKPEDVYKHIDKNKNNYFLVLGKIDKDDKFFKNLNRKKYITGYRAGYLYSIYLILPRKK